MESGNTENLISHYLWVIVAPILIIFGTIGNLSCVAVMCRSSLRSSNASVYLIALALADTLVLYTGPLRHVVREVSDIDVRDSSDLSCRINSWIVYVALDTSVWILVAFTFERILSVFVPHKVKSYCTRMSSVLVITGVMVLMMAINGHLLYGRRERVYRWRNTTTRACGHISKEYRLFASNVFPWLDFGVFNCVPFCILIIGNSCIATRVLLSRRKTRKVSALGVAQAPSLPSQNANIKLTFKASKRTDRTSSMTRTMLILNCVFLITTTPVSVYFIVLPKLHISNTDYNAAVFNLVYTVVNLIMYINNSVNFILYCFTGSRFRKELIGIFKKQHTWIVERSARSGQDEIPSRTSPAVKRQVPATQTSEVPYTVSLFPDEETVNITSSVITHKGTVNIASSIITDKDAVNIISSVITDMEVVDFGSQGKKDALKITSEINNYREECPSQDNTDNDTEAIILPVITDTGSVNSASPAITETDSVNITSPVISHATDIMSPVLANKDTIKTSPVITDINNINNPSRVITDIDDVSVTSPLGACVDKANITTALISDTDIVVMTLQVLPDTANESSI